MDVKALIEGGYSWGVLRVCLDWDNNKHFSTIYCDVVGVF